MVQKILVMAMVLAFTFTNAQDLKGFIKDKTNSAVKKTSKEANKEAGKEADKGIDKGIDKLKGKIKGDGKNSSDTLSTEQPANGNSSPQDNEEKSVSSEKSKPAKNTMNIPGFNTGEPAKYNESYSFVGFFSMKIENWDEDGKSDGPINYNTYYSTDNKFYAFEFANPDKKNEKSLYIMDYVNNSMIMAGADEENKSGMVMTMAAVSYSDTVQSETTEESGTVTPVETDNYQMKKTGKTKTILGYLCEEYEQNDGETLTNLWITKDLKMDAARMYGGMAGLNYLGGYGYGSGFMMEMTSVHLKSNEKTYYIVTAIDPAKKTDFSLKDYQLMNMGSMSVPQE
ncbi:MAG: hypothetical protein A2W91_03060 [Bacteroidetes bacterium GWF2_38_335]|nr:MAG: hypothetical protein A2W91_03060 [Bacteroidetes bacterium GWF2_38_335]OFY77530.1 MAG: hypothetical protein A2281_01700 [Bacteroidetes bacterium RIFOXYA12_FULL_38_20]HBS87173.1 hypothetical protein [Bacteroidales bacterium]